MLGHGVEREIKLRFPSAEDARRRVLGLGATPSSGGGVCSTTSCSTAPDHRLLAAGTALRVRADGPRALLAPSEGPVVPGAVKAREEIETEATESPTSLLAILRCARDLRRPSAMKSMREEFGSRRRRHRRRRHADSGVRGD